MRVRDKVRGRSRGRVRSKVRGRGRDGGRVKVLPAPAKSCPDANMMASTGRLGSMPG